MDEMPRIRIPQELWDTIPLPAQAALLVVFAQMDQLEKRVAQLEAEVADLKARLDQNSSNSSKPPSSDPLHAKRRPPEKPSGKKRGGQPGHERHMRTLVPSEEVAETVECKPTACRRCGHELLGEDPQPRRHQVAEIPPIKPHVTEYRRHYLACPCCGVKTLAPLPAGVPSGSFGPRLSGMLSMLSGGYRLGKRPIQQLMSDLLGLSISTGMIAKLERKTSHLLAEPTREVSDFIRKQPVVGMDETGWRENKQKAWLWVATTPVAALFRIARSRGRDVVDSMLGDLAGRVVICDRWSAYRSRSDTRQLCWAHLRRDFQSMIDRKGEGKPIGEALLDMSNTVFTWWHQFGREEISRGTLATYIRWLRPLFEKQLENGMECSSKKAAATCRDLYDHRAELWTFVRTENVEPTNNASERTLRHAVLWRKTSGGTDSEEGSRFVERILTVLATCRRQGRAILDYLAVCHQAAIDGQTLPSILPSIPAKIQAA
jgi:transposase